MKVSMAKQKAQKGKTKSAIMADWKGGKLPTDEAQKQLAAAGV